MRGADRVIVLGTLFAAGCSLLTGASDLETGPLEPTPDVADADANANDAPVAQLDSATEAATAHDAGVDADAGPRCDPAKPFGAPTAVTGLKSVDDSNDFGCTLSPDERTIYFASDRLGGLGSYDLYSASRANADLPFSAIAPLAPLNTVDEERHPTVTADGLTLIYRIGVGTAVGDLRIAQRASTAVPFSPAAPIAAINTPQEEGDPFLTPSGDALYLSATRGGAAGGSGIFISAKTGTTYGTATLVPGLSGLNDATLSADELTVFIGVAGVGVGQDIRVATRPSKAAPFGPTVDVPTLNSAVTDQPDWLSPDGCRMYLTSARAGKSQLFVAARPR